MDHRVAKDMISSGMIPSGEKKKEDLGRPQYGTVPSPNALADAYKSMYDKKEEVINEHHKKDADGNTIPHEDEELKEGAGLYANIHAKRKRGGKMRKKGDKGAPSSQDFANASKTAKEEVDKFDVVYNHFISEGYSEKEAYAKMANLTEEQLDEFLKALAQAGMRGAQSVGRATKGVATKVAQQGANLGKPASQKIDVINPKRKPFDAKPKPGDSGFKAKSASDVVSAAAAMRKKRMEKEMEPKKGEVMADEYQHQIDEALPLVLTKAAKVLSTIAKKPIAKKLAGDVATGAAMSAGSNLMSGGGGGGQQKPNKTANVSASADLFDIVKGQLLDEGLSEEEIKDIMLTLTPDEILNELSVGKMANYISAADKDVQKTADSMRKDSSVMGDDPRIKRMTNRAKGMAMAGDKIAKNPIK